MRGLEFFFSSAGVMARDGLPPTEHGASVMAERGIDIRGIRSRRLSGVMIAEADWIVAMEEEHRLAIMDFPEAAGKPVELLSEWAGEPHLGPGIEDPIGGSRGDYEKTAGEIESYIKRALARLEASAAQGLAQGGGNACQEGG
jgi:protein-tyrosine phosphatase